MSDRDVMSKEEYFELMSKIVQEKVGGKSVTIPLDFLYSIQMFLQASSHLEDEGRLPYPSFQFLSHDLSYKIREYTKEHIKFFPQDCYISYENLWEKYQDDTKDEGYDEDAE